MVACTAHGIVHRCRHPAVAGHDGVRARLPRLLPTLPRLQRRIVILRFYRNLTPTQIAVHVGLSQLQVTRLLRSATRQLQTALLAG
jgi:RNA polymerase sigma factor (sigma-70 family)